jgi:hypothetical protein
MDLAKRRAGPTAWRRGRGVRRVACDRTVGVLAPPLDPAGRIADASSTTSEVDVLGDRARWRHATAHMTHRLASTDPTGTLRLARSDWHPPTGTLRLASSDRRPPTGASDWHPPTGTLTRDQARASKRTPVSFSLSSQGGAAPREHPTSSTVPSSRSSHGPREVPGRSEGRDSTRDACRAHRDAAERVAAVASAVLEVCSNRVAKRDVAVFTSAVLEVCSDHEATPGRRVRRGLRVCRPRVVLRPRGEGAVVFVAWRVIARSVCSHLPSILPGALRTRPR